MSTCKVVVVDCKGHLLGRLASKIAKELLKGRNIVAVRCEEILLSGPFYRNKIRFHAWLRKKHRTNPRRSGPFHHRAPARILWRVVRGMVPHKTDRGTKAMGRFRSYEGVPPPYDRMKRMVVPAALRVLRVKPMRKVTSLKRLSTENGWKHSAVVEKLEAKRKVKSAAYYRRKKALIRLRAQAIKQSEKATQAQTQILSAYGY